MSDETTEATVEISSLCCTKLKTYPELWQSYKHSIVCMQDDLKLQLYSDIVDLIAGFTIFQEVESGQFIEIQDDQHKWYVSIVIAVRRLPNGKLEAFIRYCNWPRKWDEWVTLESGRIQALGMHTGGIPYFDTYKGRAAHYKYADEKKDFKLSCGSMVSYNKDFGVVIKYKYPKVHVHFKSTDTWIRIYELDLLKMPSKEWKCICGNLNKDIYYKTLTDNYPGICGKCGEMFFSLR